MSIESMLEKMNEKWKKGQNEYVVKFSDLPLGKDYVGKLIAAPITENSDGSCYITFKYSIVEGQYKGKIHSEFQNINPEYLEFLEFSIRRFGFELPDEFRNDITLLPNVLDEICKTKPIAVFDLIEKNGYKTTKVKNILDASMFTNEDSNDVQEEEQEEKTPIIKTVTEKQPKLKRKTSKETPEELEEFLSSCDDLGLLEVISDDCKDNIKDAVNCINESTEPIDLSEIDDQETIDFLKKHGFSIIEPEKEIKEESKPVKKVVKKTTKKAPRKKKVDPDFDQLKAMGIIYGVDGCEDCKTSEQIVELMKGYEWNKKQSEIEDAEWEILKKYEMPNMKLK